MLDKVNGERLDGLGDNYVIVPWRKWADTNIGEAAITEARRRFQNSGAMLPIIITEDDILVQEYPLTGQLLILVARWIAGKPVFSPWVCKFPPETIAELRVAGRWMHSGTVN